MQTGEHIRRFGTPREDQLSGYPGPVVSPDGSRLAFTSTRGTGELIAAEDACLRALAIAELASVLEPELQRLGMRDLYYEIEHPLVPVLARMRSYIDAV